MSVPPPSGDLLRARRGQFAASPPVLIDLRRPAAFETDSATPGAISLPWPRFGQRSVALGLPADKAEPVLVFGAGKGAEAAQLLREDGYSSAFWAGGVAHVRAALSERPAAAHPLRAKAGQFTGMAPAVIDLRPAGASATTPAPPGALSIPWASFGQRSELGLPVDKVAPVLLIGAGKGPEAARMLRADGYSAAFFAGGVPQVQAALGLTDACTRAPLAGLEPPRARAGQFARAAVTVVDLRAPDVAAANPAAPGAVSVPWRALCRGAAVGLPADKAASLLVFGRGKGAEAARLLRDSHGYTAVWVAGGPAHARAVLAPRPAQALPALRDVAGALIVDLRPAARVAAAPAPAGSLHIPFAKFAQRFELGLSSDRAASVVCVGGPCAAQAAQTLRDDGFADVQVAASLAHLQDAIGADFVGCHAPPAEVRPGAALLRPNSHSADSSTCAGGSERGARGCTTRHGACGCRRARATPRGRVPHRPAPARPQRCRAAAAWRDCDSVGLLQEARRGRPACGQGRQDRVLRARQGQGSCRAAAGRRRLH